MTEHLSCDERFRALMEQGLAHLQEERFRKALQSYEDAGAMAQVLGDRRAQDRAFVSQCAVEMVLARGLPRETLQELRSLLMACDDILNRWLTAYTISRAYEFDKENRKGLFYARIALDQSHLLDSPERLASSYNQVGNFLLAQSRFDEARTQYEEALVHLLSGPSRRKALILTNLGYAKVVLGVVDQGVSLLYRGLRMLRSVGAHRDQVFPHLDLCYALLELHKFRHALKHGTAALTLAEEAGEHDSIKHALFLLGETAQHIGDPARARHLFERLQTQYFPEISYLPDVLLSLDVRNLVNLKA